MTVVECVVVVVTLAVGVSVEVGTVVVSTVVCLNEVEFGDVVEVLEVLVVETMDVE